MREFDPPSSEDKSNRFDGASVPWARSEPARSEPARDELVRDVSIESLLRRLDAALEAIQLLDLESSDDVANPDVANPDVEPQL